MNSLFVKPSCPKLCNPTSKQMNTKPHEYSDLWDFYLSLPPNPHNVLKEQLNCLNLGSQLFCCSFFIVQYFSCGYQHFIIWFIAYEVVKQVGLWVLGIPLYTSCKNVNKTVFSPIRCGNRAQSEPKVLLRILCGSGEKTTGAQLYDCTKQKNWLSSCAGLFTWVSATSCRWSWGRICFARAFCPACSALIKNSSFPPPVPSSAQWTRPLWAWKTTNAGEMSDVRTQPVGAGPRWKGCSTSPSNCSCCLLLLQL